MRSDKRWFVLLGAGSGLLFAVALLGFLFYLGSYEFAVPAILFLVLLYGWVFHIFVRYRQARQDELLHVIVASVDAKLPLVGALRAYLHDRPHDALYHFLVGLILHVIVAPYFWLAHELYKFDHRVGELIDELACGEPLSQALKAVPAVSSRETRVAAAIGEMSGNLAECLRRSARERMTAAWLELIPRFVYPFVLLFFIFGLVAFFMVTLFPKFQAIFRDFKMPLPRQTLLLISWWDGTLQNVAWVGVGVVVLILVITGLVWSPTLRWYFPGIGRLYSWELRSLVLRSLGMLLEMGHPAPRALELLQEAGDWPTPLLRRLDNARRSIEAGQPLAAALRSARLLSASMVPLVQSAERSRNLPWTLSELGELLSGRAYRVARRLSMFVAPLLVVAIGVVVGLVVIGIFVPLVNLIEGLT